MKKFKYSKFYLLIGWMVYIFIFIFIIFPYWIAFSASLNESPLSFLINPSLSSSITISNYTNLLETDFINWIINSAFISIVVILVNLILSSTIAFYISHRSESKLIIKKLLIFFFIFGFIAPSGVLFIPISKSWYSNLFPYKYSLIFIYLSFIVPQSIWILKSFLNSINKKLEYVVLMEGGSSFKYIIKILFPQVKNGLIFVTAYSLILSWGEYVYSLILTNKSTDWTYAVGITSLEKGDVVAWGEIMAGVILGALPIAVIFLITWTITTSKFKFK